MRDPLYRLRQLPWRSLLQVAVLTTLVSIVIDFGLGVAAVRVPVVTMVLGLLFSPSLAVLTSLGIAIGIGAIAVLILEALDRSIISAGSLWALVLCLIGFAVLRSFVPPVPITLQASYTDFLGFVLGVFWKGRPYWRSFRRW
jgi:hypothetical protein